jgi:protein-L-isoaspartate(D-aspartate) O-methyltransferase
VAAAHDERCGPRTGVRRAGGAAGRAKGSALSARGRRFPVALDRTGRAAPRPASVVVGAAPRVAPTATPKATPSAAPSGVGLDSQQVRSRMVDRLRAQGLVCKPVIDALSRVPRHAFVDAALAAQAYEDTSLPIGHGQTISKPSVVARMLSLLFEARGTAPHLGRVLEIGTGCGYQAALLSHLATRVISIERLRPLHDKARDNLASMRASNSNLRLVYGDGRIGHAPNAPYDAIVCAAGGEDILQAWLDQLAVGGRLVAPTHDDARGSQVLVTVDRHDNGWSRREHDAVHFVPLRSGTA